MSDQPEFPTCLAFDGLEACILVDGKEVPHYGVECNEEKREFSCWIESEAGKPFAYQFKRIRDDYDCTIRTCIDGQSAEYILIRKEQNINWAPRHSIRISPTEIRKLMFGSLELTDDDAYLESSPQNLGEIKIVFTKVRIVRQRDTAPKKFDPQPQKIHERSKKGMSHQVSFGKAVQTTPHMPKTFEIDPFLLWATFIFRYRPLAMLQANGIAPLNPITPTPQEEPTPLTPPPQQKKRKLSEVKQEIDEEEDEDDIEATERALLAQLEKVRQRKLARDGNSSGSKRVKQEPQTYFAPGEIIDLT